jgi:hypothetical protein
MSSFNIVQFAYGVGGSGGAATITLPNPTTAGNLLIVYFGGGQPYSGTINYPSSVTYDPIISGSPTPVPLTIIDQGCDNPLDSKTALYYIKNILAGGLHIVYNGGTYYPYGPSMIAIEISTTSKYLILGLAGDVTKSFYGSTQSAGATTAYVHAYLGLAGTTIRTGPQFISFDAVNSHTVHATTAIMLINPDNDVMLIAGDYDQSNSHTNPTNVPWITSGTVIAETYELNPGAGGMSGVLAYFNFPFLTGSGCTGGVPPFSIVCGDPPNGCIGVAYTHTFPEVGGVLPLSYTVTAGTLPPGLTLTDNVLSGTPTTLGSWWFTITVTDADSNTEEVTCSIGICTCGGNGNYAFYSRH